MNAKEMQDLSRIGFDLSKRNLIFDIRKMMKKRAAKAFRSVNVKLTYDMSPEVFDAVMGELQEEGFRVIVTKGRLEQNYVSTASISWG